IWDIKKTVQYTIEWYRMHLEENFVITDEQIKRYLNTAKENELIWAY
ncbi:MAG: CDP-glucose 4,6-dehydratase, partial [Rhodobacteraceae bacterium]